MELELTGVLRLDVRHQPIDVRAHGPVPPGVPVAVRKRSRAGSAGGQPGRAAPPTVRPCVRRLPSMSVWIVLGAIAVAVLIAWLGLTALRAASGVGVDLQRPEPEDVDDLEVYLGLSRVRDRAPGHPAGRAPDPSALRRADGGRAASGRRRARSPTVVHSERPVPGRFSRCSPQISRRLSTSMRRTGPSTPVDKAVGNHTHVIRGASASAWRR